MTSQIKIQFFKHPYAEFVLGAFEGKLCLCDFRYRKMRSAVDARIQSGLKATFVEKNDPLL
jgi:methylated-DNA-[protein]-cysteine S-methyltransferase